MKKSKTVIGIGVFYLFISIVSLKNFYNIDSLLIFGRIIPKYYSMIWYLFWSLLGIAIGIGFIKHKYVFWKIAIVKSIISFINISLNVLFATDDKVFLIFGSALNTSQYKYISFISLFMPIIVFILILTQKPAFKRFTGLPII